MALKVYPYGVYVCAAVIVLISLPAFSRGYGKPTILSESEVIVEAQGNFTVLCEGDAPLNWSWPLVEDEDYLGWFEIKFFDALPKNKSRRYGSRIFLRNATYLHTGNFICYYENLSNDDQVDKVYLYVRDEEHLSVSQMGVESLIVTQYSDVVIPCRPTSPDVTVELTWITEEKLFVGVINEDGTMYTFDPRYGYKTNNTLVAKQEIYYCTFTRDKQTEVVTIILDVETITESLAKPLLLEVSGGHTLVGQELVLECRVKTLTFVTFAWTTPTGPVDSSRMKVSSQKKSMYEEISQNLTIKETTQGDNGVYYCNVTDNQEHHSYNSLNVKVYRENEHFIDLSEDNGIYNISVKAGEPFVHWLINVKGHPQPTVEWFNNNNQLISTGWSAKYNMSIKPTEAELEIKNIAINDYGNYTLVAENKYEKKRLPLFLNVTDAPTVELKLNDFYEIGRKSLVTCVVLASPPPTVKMFFKHCQDLSCEFKKVPSVMKQNKGFNFTFESPIISANSGEVECKAKNALGEVEVNQKYNVTDVKRGFDIFDFGRNVDFDNRTTVNVANGDNLQMVCGVSIHKNPIKIEWLHDNKILTDGEKISVRQSSTKYSKRSTLTVQNVTVVEGGNYSCRVLSKSSPFMSKTLKLLVSDPIYPVIRATNMKKKEMEIEFREKAELYCFVSGLPKPQVKWFKNNEPLQLSEKMKLRNDNQNLSFLSTMPEDEGTYKCEAFNKLGSVSKEINLKIINNPIAGTRWYILIIGILLVIVVLITVFMVFKIRNERKLQKELRIAGLANFEKGALENLNPELGIDDQAELLPYDKKWEFPIEKLKLGKQLGSGAFGVVVKGEAKGIIEGENTTIVAVKMVKKNAGHAYIKALASELKIMVHLGKHLNVVNLLGACTKNVAKRELLVIVEYCRYGNLQNYLLRHRDNFIDQVNTKTGHIDYTIGQDALERSYSMSSNRSNSQSPYMKYAALSFSNNSSNGSQVPQDMVDYRGDNYNGTTAKTEVTVVSMCPNSGDEGVIISNNSSVQPEWRSNYRGDYKGNVRPICTKDLLAWAFQVSRGMEYLASRRVLHGDLAARNILLADNNVVKICDFGLAKSMYKNDNYKKKGDGPLPVKWMAIESIRDKVFSTQSDVWSFGIVLWEFFSLARTPYPGMEADERLYNKLLDGYRMESPEYAPKEVYKMMMDCWQAKPLMRPSFSKLAERIGSMLEDTVRKHYIDLNDPYLAMNTQRLEEGHNDYLAMLSPPNFENLSSPHNYVNDLPPEEDTAGYLCMKSANIFSPRPADERLFDFDVVGKNKREKNSTDGTGTELAPMLSAHSESDHEGSSCNSPVALNSFSNPSYHLPPIVDKDQEKSEKDLVKFSDNYVNMPQSKSALKENNNPFIQSDKELKDVNYVNSTSRDWESVRL